MNAEATTRPAAELPGWTSVTDAEGRIVALVRDERLAVELVRALQGTPESPAAKVCVGCGAHSRVIDSREGASGAVRRRRRCDACGVSWTTYETRRPDAA